MAHLCTRMCPYPFFEATPPGAAPGPSVEPGPVFVTSEGVKTRAPKENFKRVIGFGNNDPAEIWPLKIRTSRVSYQVSLFRILPLPGGASNGDDGGGGRSRSALTRWLGLRTPGAFNLPLQCSVVLALALIEPTAKIS